ncbi:MAG: ATP synthase F1 subunit delta [Verrucomicrobia bacterium]|nr:ATP synthase F1 subunit delta [Verrucomicrobiota bacterium]
MQERTIAIRYARALLATTEERQESDAVIEEMRQLGTLIEASSDLKRLLHHVALSATQQQNAVTALFENRCHATIFRFLLFLIKQRRLEILADIIIAYDDLYRERRGIQRVVIECAASLREDQIEAIKARMHAIYNKTIEATVAIIPSLIGGFRVRVADTVHDFSVSGKLETMRRTLISV